MQVEPPRRDTTFAEPLHLLRTFAVAASAVVAMFAVLAGGLVLLRHSSVGGPAPKPTPGVITAPTPTTIHTPLPPSTTPSGSPCAAAQLEMRLGWYKGTGGNALTYLIFTNLGTTPCLLQGTPRVSFLGSDGLPLTTPSVVDAPSGYFPSDPNDGVALIPLTDEGTGPGPAPEGGVRGQASLPLQYQNGCANSVAAVAVDVGGGRLVEPFTLNTIVPGGNLNCQSVAAGGTFVVTVNPFQPAEYMIPDCCPPVTPSPNG